MSLHRCVAALMTGAVLLSACASQPITQPTPTTPAPVVVTPRPIEEPTPNPPEKPPEKPPEEPTPPPPPVVKKMELPKEVRGIQVTGWIAGTSETLDSLLTWAREAGINAVVVDLKAEDGKLTWNSDIPLAKEIGANVPKVADFPKTVAKFHENGFWVIGRIVVFNDPVLYRARPDWVIPGLEGTGYSFLKPMETQVWDYNLEIAKAATEAGVNEIHFDYIRFSERLIAGYNKDTTSEFRTGHINDFLKQAVQVLKPLDVYVSGAVFGLTTSVVEGDDMKLGQDYRMIAEIVDFISPMIYPSHYDRGTYGLDDPDKAPYETVKRSMEAALQRTEGIPIEKHRPWIQDFAYPAQGYMNYGKEEVEAQIRALHELGINSYLIWDPVSKFTRTVKFKTEL